MKSLVILFAAVLAMQFVTSCTKTQSKEEKKDSTELVDDTTKAENGDSLNSAKADNASKTDSTVKK